MGSVANLIFFETARRGAAHKLTGRPTRGSADHLGELRAGTRGALGRARAPKFYVGGLGIRFSHRCRVSASTMNLSSLVSA